MELELNYWAILVAALFAIVLGALWFGPLFGKQWMRIIGIAMPGEMTRSMKQSMMRSYAIQAIASLVMSFVLAHMLAFTMSFMEVEGIFGALTGALWLWLGFVVPATIGSVLWENRPWKYWFINAGYYLVALCGMSAILTLWQ